MNSCVMPVAMRQASREIILKTSGPGLLDITAPILEWVSARGIQEGLLTVFVRHTSASLTIQENADPDVLRDLADFFADIAPRGRAWRHTAEGSDDMPAHVRAALTLTQIGVPVVRGRPVLGTWQGIYLFEHRDRPHSRRIYLHLLGD